MKKVSIHFWKCQKFAKSRCRPTFLQRNKTSGNIPLCKGKKVLSFHLLKNISTLALHNNYGHCALVLSQLKHKRISVWKLFHLNQIHLNSNVHWARETMIIINEVQYWCFCQVIKYSVRDPKNVCPIGCTSWIVASWRKKL